MIATFLKLQLDFKTASNIKTLFEVALLKLLTLDDAVEEKVAKVSEPVKVQVKPVAEAPKVVEAPKPEPILEPEPPKPAPAPVTPAPKPEPVKEPEPIVDETVAPDWLVDDDNAKKNVELDGERYDLDDDVIIKLMVLGDKDLRKSITNRWDELNAFLGHPTMGDLVALLKDGSPLVVTKDAILLVYDFEKLAAKANVKVNSDRISQIIHQMLGREMFVYAISRSDSTRLVKAYQNLRQISKLPLPKDIHMTLEDLRK